MKTLCNLLLSGWALGSTLAFAADGDITRLTELNRSGQSAQAYQLASSMLANWEADPQFDRQYAQAALAAGRPGEGRRGHLTVGGGVEARQTVERQGPDLAR